MTDAGMQTNKNVAKKKPRISTRSSSKGDGDETLTSVTSLSSLESNKSELRLRRQNSYNEKKTSSEVSPRINPKSRNTVKDNIKRFEETPDTGTNFVGSESFNTGRNTILMLSPESLLASYNLRSDYTPTSLMSSTMSSNALPETSLPPYPAESNVDPFSNEEPLSNVKSFSNVEAFQLCDGKYTQTSFDGGENASLAADKSSMYKEVAVQTIISIGSYNWVRIDDDKGQFCFDNNIFIP